MKTNLTVAEKDLAYGVVYVEKPHISFYRGKWWCSSVSVSLYGMSDSPLTAYIHWRLVNAI